MLYQPTGYHKLRLKKNEFIYLPAPTPKGKPYGKPRGKPSPQFLGGSSGRGGNRGTAYDSSKLQHQQNSKPGSKNPQGGGGPPSNPRGNQANRGRGQSRRGITSGLGQREHCIRRQVSRVCSIISPRGENSPPCPVRGSKTSIGGSLCVLDTPTQQLQLHLRRYP